MNAIKTLAALSIFTALSSHAQPNVVEPGSPEMVERIRAAMDAAYAQAKGNQAAATTNDRSALSPQQMRQVQKADPADVAARFKANLPKPQIDEDQLMVFVSTGMPPKALQLLGEQAKAAGAVLVFRGLRMPLGKPGALEDMATAVAPVAKTGAELQINPEAFSKYRVTVVPTFVMAAKQEGCATDQCASKAYALAGDVSLEYALETWSGKGGTVGKMADHYLARIERSRGAQ